jgi:SAM-dependent methyltransferase
MNEVPAIFDERLRRRRRSKLGVTRPDADFLVEHAARELADRLQAINRTFGTIVCHGALNWSQTIASQGFATDIAKVSPSNTAIVLDEASLPFASGSLDAYVSVLSLHAVNDLPGALAQTRRALKPDGLFVAAMFGGNTLTELRKCLADAELEIEGGVSPRVFPFADVRDMGSLLQRAGFSLPVTDSEELLVNYRNPAKLLQDLREMAETNVLVERRKTFLKKRVLFRALELYAERFTQEDGTVRATFEIVYLTGWAPHESQQKPLRPGSARMSLADAIRTSAKPEKS